jgi:flagellar motor switch protein FliN/FliY
MTPLEEIAHFADVPVAVEAHLDRKTMTVRELLGLEVGGVVWLTRSAGENLDLYVGGTLLGYGEIVIIENSMGVRITDFKEEG